MTRDSFFKSLFAIILQISMMLVLVQCASPKYRPLDSKGPDLMDVFKLEGDEFNKFKGVVAKEYDDKKEEVEPADKSVETVKTEKIEKKKLAKRVVDIYPSGYPKQYKNHDKNSSKIWNLFKSNFYSGEVITLSVSYLGLSAGQVRIITGPYVYFNGTKTIHFRAEMKSSSFYKMFYEIDDLLDMYVEKDNFLPVKYSFVQNETGQSVNDLQLFDLKDLKTYYRYKRVKKGMLKEVKKDVFIPKYFQSYLSIFFFFRGLPLNIGDIYEFPIVSRAKIGTLQVKVVGSEKIDTKIGEQSSIKLQATVAFPDKKKNDYLEIWFANDERKSLLKFKAEVKIGNIIGEIENLRPGERL